MLVTSVTSLGILLWKGAIEGLDFENSLRPIYAPGPICGLLCCSNVFGVTSLGLKLSTL